MRFITVALLIFLVVAVKGIEFNHRIAVPKTSPAGMFESLKFKKILN